MACLQMIVQLYKDLMKVYMNQTNIYEGSNAMVENKDKDQAAGLEIAESFFLCGPGLQYSHQEYCYIHPE
jgi:hypothetical protein